MASAGPGRGDLNTLLSGNVCGFQASDACECGQIGYQYENLFYQTAANISGVGKSGQNFILNAPYVVSYNGFLEPSWFYTSPYLTSTSSNFATCCGWGGIAATYSKNLIVNATPASEGGATGLDVPNNGQAYPLVATTWENNVACGMAFPVGPIGQILYNDPIYNTGFSINGGSGYTPNTGSGSYGIYEVSPFAAGNGTAQPYTIPLVGGHGSLAFVNLVVNGSTSEVTKVYFQYESNGVGYQVGDVLSLANDYYVGGQGSGFTLTVDSPIGGGGQITHYHISNPGSGYLAPYNMVSGSTLTGSGSGAKFDVTVNANGHVVAVYPDPQGYGKNYSPGDHVGFNGLAGGSGAYITVGLVTGGASSLTFSNNTLQAANCNNLQNATGTVDGFQSVAPPLVPSASPPTDVIGQYFASLPYGYSEPIPTVLYRGAMAQTTGYEVAYSDYIQWQQKGNWDPKLMPHALLNWARPQFGMVNPH